MFSLSRISSSPIPLELDGVLPERVAGMSLPDIARLPVLHGNRTEELGLHFDLSGDPTAGEMRFVGDCSTVKRVGFGMTTGRIVVEGDVGLHAGAQMTGGSLQVLGRAGDWLGCEMRGGRIEAGSAGNQAGGAYVGSRHGMRGGRIRIHGDVGAEAGAKLRRGLIIIHGNMGQFAGADLIAGTIVVAGQLGARAGAGMKRGTILALGEVAEVSPTFRESCVYEPTYLKMLAKSLNLPLPSARVRCFRGDILEGGRGELLLANRGC